MADRSIGNVCLHLDIPSLYNLLIHGGTLLGGWGLGGNWPIRNILFQFNTPFLYTSGSLYGGELLGVTRRVSALLSLDIATANDKCH